MERGESGAELPAFSGPPTTLQFRLPKSCDAEELVRQPSEEECEAYAAYLHLAKLSRLQKMRVWPDWSNEPLFRPALHSLEMVFRMISSALSDPRAYVDSREWVRRLEGLANGQIELISLFSEGDGAAPAKKQSAPGLKSHAPLGRASQESILARMAGWRKAQGLVSRLHLAVEGNMLRAPFTLGLGEPNLAGKPVLEYDRVCTPAEVYACQHRTGDAESPEDHALASAHQIMESWLAVAQCLVERIEQRIADGDTEEAANQSWILERVWKLFTRAMDLLQVMDPGDFMKLKQTLEIKPVKSTDREGQDGVPSSSAASGGHTSGAATFCLRSLMLRGVTKACKELRGLVPKAMGVEVDPEGGPRLQEAIMELFNSHGMKARGPFAARTHAHNSGTIHLLQAFQAVEVAIRQFYFTYRHLVITVIGSGEYTGAIQPEISGADALLQLYSEPPYFPSVDGARTFLGDFWLHHHTSAGIMPPSSPTDGGRDDEAARCPPAAHLRFQLGNDLLPTRKSTSNPASQLGIEEMPTTRRCPAGMGAGNDAGKTRDDEDGRRPPAANLLGSQPQMGANADSNRLAAQVGTDATATTRKSAAQRRWAQQQHDFAIAHEGGGPTSRTLCPEAV